MISQRKSDCDRETLGGMFATKVAEATYPIALDRLRESCCGRRRYRSRLLRRSGGRILPILRSDEPCGLSDSHSDAPTPSWL